MAQPLAAIIGAIHRELHELRLDDPVFQRLIDQPDQECLDRDVALKQAFGVPADVFTRAEQLVRLSAS